MLILANAHSSDCDIFTQTAKGYVFVCALDFIGAIIARMNAGNINVFGYKIITHNAFRAIQIRILQIIVRKLVVILCK